ncbi:MAG TPA: hypothetical protein VII95_20060 [Terriglobales bacterium]|jgi:predicted RNase H-like HicB family nuclease
MPTHTIQSRDPMAQIDMSQHHRQVHRCLGCGKPLIAEPVLICSKCGHELRLRCFCYQAGDRRYIAECIDLDIISEGETREDAIGGLQEAMFGYLTAVIDGQDTDGLVPRRAPLSHRLRYYYEASKDILRGFDRQHAQSVIECRYEVRDGQLLDCQ